MRPKLTTLRHNGDFRLAFAYADGLVTELDFHVGLAARQGPMIELLRGAQFFAQAFIDHGVLTWPNGFDVCPDVLRAWCESGRILNPEETNAWIAQPRPQAAVGVS